MYGGQCSSEYAQSLFELRSGMERAGHQVTCIFLGNESLIQRARNTIVHHFMKTDATHLLFMDADQKFRARDIAGLIRSGKDVIGGIVPMKGINWEAVRAGAQAGAADLSTLTGHFNINRLEGHDMVSMDMPFQVRHIGTGCMLIHRGVFERLKKHVKYYTNGGTTIAPGERIYNYFSAEVVDHELLSEDYHFCHLWRQEAGTVWAAPWCEIGHFGPYLFAGRYLP